MEMPTKLGNEWRVSHENEMKVAVNCDRPSALQLQRPPKGAYGQDGCSPYLLLTYSMAFVRSPSRSLPSLRGWIDNLGHGIELHGR